MGFTENLRKCTVDGKPMYFHRWIDKSWIVPPSPMVGGHQGGVVRGTFAIVEDAKTRVIEEVTPEKVKFEDRKMKVARYGYWKVSSFSKTDKKFIECSACNSVIDCNKGFVDENEYDYCPYCGADMEKEVQNDD